MLTRGIGHFISPEKWAHLAVGGGVKKGDRLTAQASPDHGMARSDRV